MDSINERWPLDQDTSVLRLVTAGSVDDGKSTLIGRLLLDSKGVFSDQLKAISGSRYSRPLSDHAVATTIRRPARHARGGGSP